MFCKLSRIQYFRCNTDCALRCNTISKLRLAPKTVVIKNLVCRLENVEALSTDKKYITYCHDPDKHIKNIRSFNV